MIKQDLDLSLDDDDYDVHSWINALNERELSRYKKKKVSLITKQHPLSKGAPYHRQKNRYIDPSIGKYPYC